MYFLIFFASSGMAALTGGMVHSFFPEPLSVLGAALWKTTLIFLGMMALAGWSLGAEFIFSQKAARLTTKLAVFEFIAYFGFIILVNDAFWVAIANNAPMLVFLMISLFICHVYKPQKALLYGIIGIALMPFAAILQQWGFAINPVYFNHNATYHMIQALAFWLFFIAAKELIQTLENKNAQTPFS